MSTEFNPASFEHEGVVYKAKKDESIPGCIGCAFEHVACAGLCMSWARPDKKDIIWVRAQEGKKA